MPTHPMWRLLVILAIPAAMLGLGFVGCRASSIAGLQCNGYTEFDYVVYSYIAILVISMPVILLQKMCLSLFRRLSGPRT